MKPDKVLSLAGLAARAGKIASGEFSTEKSVKQRQAYLVLVAGDASDNTKKHFSDLCGYRGIPYFEYADKERLGKSLGKEFRASLAVKDKNLADAIIKQIESEKQLNNGGNE